MPITPSWIKGVLLLREVRAREGREEKEEGGKEREGYSAPPLLKRIRHWPSWHDPYFLVFLFSFSLTMFQALCLGIRTFTLF